LAKGLRSVDPGGVQYHRFRWSGDNTHTARCAAAAELYSELLKLAARYPSARFLLVGHSHGGNIACAAASALPGSRCAGIVTLATPFFHIAKRSLVPATSVPPMLLFLFFVGVAGYGGSWLGDIGAKFTHWLYGTWAEAVGGHWLYRTYSAIVAIGGILSMVGLLAILIGFQVNERLSARQDKFFRAWDQLRPFAASTLSLSMTLDEALLVLSLVRRLPERLHQVRDWFHRHLVIAITVTALPLGLAFVVIYLRTSDVPINSELAFYRALVGLTWVVAAAIVVTITLWVLIVLLTAIFMRLTYGLGSVGHHLMLNVTVRRTPQIENPNLVKHRNIALPLRAFLSEKLCLVHSKLYMDPRSFEEIINWYRAR
jgi:pimeloyl-ACP methyl ester carboxylesterase